MHNKDTAFGKPVQSEVVQKWHGNNQRELASHDNV